MKKKSFDPDSFIKESYEEEGKTIRLSTDFKKGLVSEMKAARKEAERPVARIRRFMNREIEIPLIPLVAASVLLIGINLIPIDYQPRPEGRLIDVGGAQIWIPDGAEEGGYEN